VRLNNASLKIIKKHIFTFEENLHNFNDCTSVRLVPHFLIQECGNTVHNAEPVTKTKWAEAQSCHDWFSLCTDTCL